MPELAHVAVVGGGPAGLMAAEVLATAGLAVTLFEHMPTVGRKLQVAGRGGLNLTHNEGREAFLDRYGPSRAYLTAALEAFDPAALRAWADGLGQPTFVGSSGRVFPESFRATALLRAWLTRLASLGVELRTRHHWNGWTPEGALTFTDPTGDPLVVAADASVLALGGASWPRTGSDGAWTAPLRAAGIEVRPWRPANSGCIVGWSEVFSHRFAGTPVKDVTVGHRGTSAHGDLMITTDGLEGSPVYALCPALRATLDAGTPARVELDLFPHATPAEVVARLERRRPTDSVATALARCGLSPVSIGLLREATANHPPSAPGPLAALLQALPFSVTASQPIGRAISSAGGVALSAVDQSAMLRDRPGTFVAGEMLDWEAPTGGYLLQGAFSTGVAAAEGVLAWLATLRR